LGRPFFVHYNFQGGIVMDKVSGRLTVFFEEPFWIGVFERISEGKLSVCKVTFGAEPKDYEIYDFVLKNYYRLKFSSQQALKLQQEQLKTERKAVSREQREAEKQRQFELKRQKRKEKIGAGESCPGFFIECSNLHGASTMFNI
jgi:hypothetical protein